MPKKAAKFFSVFERKKERKKERKPYRIRIMVIACTMSWELG